jgi:hypothetical protein
LNPFKKSTQDVPQSKNIAPIKESKPVYFFELSKQASINSRYTLPIMHEELNAHGYIDCTLPEFKRLFFKYNQKKPTSTPIPIIWKTGHYNQLAFLIQCLSDSFLSAPKSPSNYDSATHLFCNKENGIYFTIKKKRYDYNLNLKGQEIIKSIVNRSIKSHI